MSLHRSTRKSLAQSNFCNEAFDFLLTLLCRPGPGPIFFHFHLFATLHVLLPAYTISNMYGVDAHPSVCGENDRYNIYNPCRATRSQWQHFSVETIFTSGDRKVEVILMSRLARAALNSRDTVFTGSLYSLSSLSLCLSATSCARLAIFLAHKP